MTQFLRLPTIFFTLPAVTCLLFLNACTATTTSGPSAALKQQFAQIQQEQRQQAEQLSKLQQQLAELQQHLLSAPTQPYVASEETAAEGQLPQQMQPTVVPAAIKQEIAGLADSAASYLAAFSNLAAGRYSIAESGFNSFLSSYPQHQYSANARYWLASAQLEQGKVNLAATNLRQVMVSPLGQDRAPSAMMLLAKLYRQQQQPEAADDLLEQLRERYPDSAEAQQLAPATTL